MPPVLREKYFDSVVILARGIANTAFFSRLEQVHMRERLSGFAQNDGPAANHDVSRNIRLLEIVFEAESPPKVVIDAGGVLTAVRKLESDMLRARHEAETVNEELQAANEELQSTNEELETMNEELQSANEELQTINEELRDRTDELNSSNAFLNSILFSLRGGVAVVDRNINVTIWNRMAEDLWGMRSEEVKGQSLLNLDIGLPVAKLGNALRACISKASSEPQELLLKAVTRRARNITCRVTINPFLAQRGERQGAIVIMEEMGK